MQIAVIDDTKEKAVNATSKLKYSSKKKMVPHVNKAGTEYVVLLRRSPDINSIGVDNLISNYSFEKVDT